MTPRIDKVLKSKELFTIYSPHPLLKGDVLEIPWKSYDFIVSNDKRRLTNLYQCTIYTTGEQVDVPFEDIVEVTKPVRLVNAFCNRYVLEKIQIPITLIEEEIIKI